MAQLRQREGAGGRPGVGRWVGQAGGVLVSALRGGAGWGIGAGRIAGSLACAVVVVRRAGARAGWPCPSLRQAQDVAP